MYKTVIIQTYAFPFVIFFIVINIDGIIGGVSTKFSAWKFYACENAGNKQPFTCSDFV